MDSSIYPGSTYDTVSQDTKAENLKMLHELRQEKQAFGMALIPQSSGVTENLCVLLAVCIKYGLRTRNVLEGREGEMSLKKKE